MTSPFIRGSCRRTARRTLQRAIMRVRSDPRASRPGGRSRFGGAACEARLARRTSRAHEKLASGGIAGTRCEFWASLARGAIASRESRLVASALNEQQGDHHEVRALSHSHRSLDCINNCRSCTPGRHVSPNGTPARSRRGCTRRTSAPADRSSAGHRAADAERCKWRRPSFEGRASPTTRRSPYGASGYEQGRLARPRRT